jgi:hypothetical protein
MIRGSVVRRLVAYVCGVGTPLSVLSPLVSNAPDSFPISTYSMFASPRGHATLYALVATTSDGIERRVSAAQVGSTEVLQAKVLIQRSVARGPEAMAELCGATAQRVAATAEGEAFEFVDIVRRRYEPIAYFVSGPAPIEQERIFRCSINRLLRDEKPLPHGQTQAP